MVGLGRAAMPQFGLGQGRALLPSSPAASEPQPDPTTQFSPKGREMYQLY